MITKKLLITGLGATATDDSIRSLLGRFGPVARVDVIRDGDAKHPVAIVEMAIDDEGASNLVFRLSDHVHDGKPINALILNH